MGLKETEELISHEVVEGYERYYRLAFSYVHNQSDALDIVQESAYKAILNSKKLKNPHLVRAWIYRIVVNEALQHINKYKKPYIELEEVANSLEGKEEEKVDQDLKDALNRLEEPDRTIVILRYFEDMKIEDIAYILQKNVSTVKSKLYRAMHKLKISLEEVSG